MIGVIASIIGGLMLREYLMFVALVVFIISLKNRDAGLIAYFLYIIYSSSKVVSGDVYTYEELINALIFAFSGVLLLDDILRRSVRVRKHEIIPILFILLGVLLPESFLAAGVIQRPKGWKFRIWCPQGPPAIVRKLNQSPAFKASSM